MGEGDGLAKTSHVVKELSKDALKGFEELAEIFFEWILPVLLVLVGVLLGAVIGLSGAIATALSDLEGISQTGVVIGSDLIAAGIWGAGSAACLAGGYAAGGYVGWILRPIGGLLLGFALSELFAALGDKVQNGKLGELTNTVNDKLTAVAGGA